MIGRTLLDEKTYRDCLKIVREYLRDHEAVRNRDVRRLTGVNYDQAIKFFARCTEEQRLDRRGNRGTTHYVLYRQRERP
jgi:hypothetical protein